MFPAPPTPVTEDGRVHEKALRALLDDNIAYGANGFWMAGTTGEGPILTEEQRDAVARISAEVCKGRVARDHARRRHQHRQRRARRRDRPVGGLRRGVLPAAVLLPQQRARADRALQGRGGCRGRPAVLRLQPAAAHPGGDGARADGEVHAGDPDAQGAEALGAQLRRHPRVRGHGPHVLLRQRRVPASGAHHGRGGHHRRAAVARTLALRGAVSRVGGGRSRSRPGAAGRGAPLRRSGLDVLRHGRRVQGRPVGAAGHRLRPLDSAGEPAERRREARSPAGRERGWASRGRDRAPLHGGGWRAAASAACSSFPLGRSSKPFTASRRAVFAGTTNDQAGITSPACRSRCRVPCATRRPPPSGTP